MMHIGCSLQLQIIIIMVESVCSYIRCYSCYWSIEDANTLPGCMAHDTLHRSDDLYTDTASCNKCLKSEVWKHGEIVSVFRSCLQRDDAFSTIALRKNSCVVQRKGIDMVSVSCVCEYDMCNTSEKHTQTIMKLLTIIYVINQICKWIFGNAFAIT